MGALIAKQNPLCCYMQVHIPLYDPATLLLLAVFSTPDKVGWPALVLVLWLLSCHAANAGSPYCAGQGVSTITSGQCGSHCCCLSAVRKVAAARSRACICIPMMVPPQMAGCPTASAHRHVARAVGQPSVQAYRLQLRLPVCCTPAVQQAVHTAAAVRTPSR